MDEEGPETPRPAPHPVSQPHLDDPFHCQLAVQRPHNTLTLRSLRAERFKLKAKALGLRQSLSPQPEKALSTSLLSPKRLRGESVGERKRDLGAKSTAKVPVVSTKLAQSLPKRPVSPAFPPHTAEEEEKLALLNADRSAKAATVRRKAIVKPDLRKQPQQTAVQGGFHSVQGLHCGKRRPASPFPGNSEKSALSTAKTAPLHLIRSPKVTTAEWK